MSENIETICNIIRCVIIGIQAVIILRPLYIGIKNKNKISLLFYRLYVVSMITQFGFVVSGILMMISAFMNPMYQHRFMFIMIHQGFGFIFLFIFAFQVYCKLKYIFIGTIYEINNCQNRLLQTALILQILFCMMAIIVGLTVSFGIGLYFTPPMGFVYKLSSIYMVIILIKKLIAILKYNNKVGSGSEKRSSRMINTVVTYIVTSIVAYASSTIIMPIAVYIMIGTDIPYIGYILYEVDFVLNIVSLYLQYNFAEKDYHLLCNLCHKCLFNIIKRKTIKSTDIVSHLSVQTDTHTQTNNTRMDTPIQTHTDTQTDTVQV